MEGASCYAMAGLPRRIIKVKPPLCLAGLPDRVTCCFLCFHGECKVYIPESPVLLGSYFYGFRLLNFPETQLQYWGVVFKLRINRMQLGVHTYICKIDYLSLLRPHCVCLCVTCVCVCVCLCVTCVCACV